MPFETERLSAVAGARLHGLDLREPLSNATTTAIEAALVEHKVLVFPQQKLSDVHQRQFTLAFGELESHVIRLSNGKPPAPVHVMTNLDESGRPTAKLGSRGTFFWHSDKSYHEIPSLATLLHALQLPPSGGDTQFANMQLAYDALDADTKVRIDGLKVEHSWEASRINTNSRLATEEEKRERPPVVQPLVRSHPVSGHKSLYLGMHASHIINWEREAGRALLSDLLEFATQERFVFTHQWQLGDLLMWDNRSLLHRAVANYAMNKHARIMHRTVVKGTVPAA